MLILSLPVTALSDEYSADYKRGFVDAFDIYSPIIAERYEIIGLSSTLHGMECAIKFLQEDETIPPEQKFLLIKCLVQDRENGTVDQIESYNRNVTKTKDRIIDIFGEEIAQSISTGLKLPLIASTVEQSTIPSVEEKSTKLPLGSRENPVPIGEYCVNLGDGWEITVLDVIPDATQLVLNENMFNERPKDGHQFVLTKIRACYNGEGSDTFNADLRMRAVGRSNVAYSTFQNSCGVIPDSFPSFTEVFDGGCIDGYIGWEIKSSDSNSLVMYDCPFSFDETERIYFSLF